MYLYAGQQLTRGARLYRDVWDHKAPVIHVINALGQLITPASAWGAWWTEATLLALAVGMSFVMLRRMAGFAPAIVGVAVWIVGFSELASGNMIQEYALAFQFAMLFCFSQVLGGRLPRLYGLLTGLAMALAFWSQPNLIALSAAILFYLAAAGWFGQARRAEIGLYLASIGFLGFTLAVVTLFALSGTLGDMWQAVFTYNALYSSASWSDRLASFSFGVRMLAPTGAPFMAFAAWGAVALAGVSRRLDLRRLHPLVAVAVLALPVEAILSILSGRQYQHYFVPWLPILAVLVAHTTAALLRGARKAGSAYGTPAVWTAALVAGIVVLPFFDWVDRVETSGPTSVTETTFRLVDFVQSETTPDEPVLVWGALPVLNWLTGRASPTRFAYQYALYTDGFQSPALFEEVLADLEWQLPALVLDTSGADGSVPPIDPERRAQWLERVEAQRSTNPQFRRYHFPPEMDILFDYILTHYERIGTIGGVGLLKRR